MFHIVQKGNMFPERVLREDHLVIVTDLMIVIQIVLEAMLIIAVVECVMIHNLCQAICAMQVHIHRGILHPSLTANTVIHEHPLNQKGPNLLLSCIPP